MSQFQSNITAVKFRFSYFDYLLAAYPYAKKISVDNEQFVIEIAYPQADGSSIRYISSNKSSISSSIKEVTVYRCFLNFQEHHNVCQPPGCLVREITEAPLQISKRPTNHALMFRQNIM